MTEREREKTSRREKEKKKKKRGKEDDDAIVSSFQEKRKRGISFSLALQIVLFSLISIGLFVMLEAKKSLITMSRTCSPTELSFDHSPPSSFYLIER